MQAVDYTLAMDQSVPQFDSEILDPPEAGSIYQAIRDDIVNGRLAPNERLVISALAARYGTSTNPIREALQQLRGEGYVVFSYNRGARVRSLDEDFIRDITEVQALIEPYLTELFVELVTDADIARLEAIQDEIETLNFSDNLKHGALDTAFHRTLYDRHYNRIAFEQWWRNREIMGAISSRFPYSLSRRTAVLKEHRELIAALRAHDGPTACEVMARHTRGSGLHIVEHMRAARHRSQN